MCDRGRVFWALWFLGGLWFLAVSTSTLLYGADSGPRSQPVAEVLGRAITARDVDVRDGQWNDLKIGMLLAKILGPLADELAAKERITVTNQEIEAFAAALERAKAKFLEGGTDPLEQERAKLNRRQRAAVEVITRTRRSEMIRQWKIDGKLYEQYGGDVVFEQFNPLEPIGAYRAFLREMEEQGKFQIHDEQVRKKFWDYLEAPRTALKPENVDFKTPWWLKPKVDE